MTAQSGPHISCHNLYIRVGLLHYYRSVNQKPYGTEFMFKGMATVHWDDVVCNGWFSEYIDCKVMSMSTNSDVQEIDLFISYTFYSEYEVVSYIC
jgi:hypothetical protein